MKKTLSILILLSLILPIRVLAVEPIVVIENPLEAKSFEELLNTIVTFIYWIAIVIAPMMIMIAAFFFLTAGGDPKRVDTARRIILWTVIGLAIILLAKGLSSVLRQIIGVK